MKKLLTLSLTLILVFATGVLAQTPNSSTGTKTNSKQASKRGPVFRATKDQINQAQALLKGRGFYSGEQIGKLDDATRDGLKKYQQAERIKVTGTLNRVTLEKFVLKISSER